MKKIRIADISEKSYISRATFYRLYNTIKDGLVYRCDRVFETVESQMGTFSCSTDLFLFFYRDVA